MSLCAPPTHYQKRHSDLLVAGGDRALAAWGMLRRLRLDRTAGCVVGHSHYSVFCLLVVCKISGRAGGISQTGLRGRLSQVNTGRVGRDSEKTAGRTRIFIGRCGPAEAGAAYGPDGALGAGVGKDNDTGRGCHRVAAEVGREPELRMSRR